MSKFQVFVKGQKILSNNVGTIFLPFQAGIFFEEIFVKAPDLRPYKEQVWKKLCSKLKGRRQYLNQLNKRKQSASQQDPNPD